MNGLFTHPRALSVSGPALSDISKPLTPLRLVGTDGINQLFDYRLTLQTSNRAGTGVGVGADLDLDSVIGKEITCTIELEGMGSFLTGTHDQIQAQLKSDHDHSQLSLGFITRIESKQGRQDPRGQGFELRTDGRGAIRTKEGLLVSTYGRPKAANHLTDMGEAVARLIQGQSLQNILAALAIKSKANDNELDQSEVALSLQLQNAQIAGIKNTATFAAASIGLSDISSDAQSEMNML
ncbi:type VI secretion system Vgr family protein, partial [Undibacterium sp. RuRC25W]|uniref:type VI secretion system Vgr family protein n=1 Tax=Undibacterium sp. RuRC25W TaxID=3413047 RepID=UPI003BF23B32